LAVTLEPARGLSGDFFDLIPLPSGRLGILIADVADKGFGAALYMALSRTLLRTYAIEYPLRPDLVFSEANERILNDATANLFITVFYGILDPEKDTLTYCNAGHNPPLRLSNTNGGSEALIRTGMPIGIDEDALWDRKMITFHPGDMLILYTDGIPDAQNESGEFFDEDQLVAVAEEHMGVSAYEMQDAILKRVRSFVNGAPQFDDITLMVLARDN
jgi:sigma-B regulation protein RsbU (phosphoserine phosphatase)